MIISYTIPKHPPRRYETDSGTVFVGKKAKSKQPIDIDLESDDYVSRRHACFQFDSGGYWIEDLGSANGTWLNGERIKAKTRISFGDAVQIGYTIFTVHMDSPLEQLEVAQDPEPEQPYIVEDTTEAPADRVITVVNQELIEGSDLYEVTIVSEFDGDSRCEIPDGGSFYEAEFISGDDDAPPAIAKKEEVTIINSTVSLSEEDLLREGMRNTAPRHTVPEEADRNTAPRNDTVIKEAMGRGRAANPFHDVMERFSGFRKQDTDRGEFITEDEADAHRLTGYGEYEEDGSFRRTGQLIASLNDLNESVSLAGSLDRVFSTLIRQLRDIIPQTVSATILLENESGVLEPRASWPDDRETEHMDTARKAVRMNQALIWVSPEETGSEDPASALFVPLASRSLRTAGVICVENDESRTAFSALDLQLLKLIAGIVANIIEN